MVLVTDGGHLDGYAVSGKPDGSRMVAWRAAYALPAPESPLIGRDAELAEGLARLNAGARLLTFTGPAGIGKTRLAIELARRVAGGERTTAFLRLAPLRDSAVLTGLIGSACALDGWPDLPIANLNDRLDSVLVFDSFDHVQDAAPTVVALLDQCPALIAIVTSRTPLQLPSEVEVPVGPLTIEGTPGQLDDATTLLMERLGGIPLESGEIAHMHASTAGNPLAIELVAARRSSNPRASGPELTEPQLLLPDVIQESIDALPTEARTLLRRISVLAGAFEPEAAAALAAMAPVIDADPSQQLRTLVRSGLVKPSTIETAPARFEIATAVRAVALDALDASGELSAVRLAHARYLLERATAIRELLVGRQRAAALAWFEIEQPGLRLAFGTFIQLRRSYLARRLVQALWPYWFLRRHYRLGRRWLKPALEMFDPSEPDDLEHELLVAAGLLELYSGNRATARDRATASAKPGLAGAQDEWRGASLATLGLLAALRGEFDRAIGLYRVYLESAEGRKGSSTWAPLLRMLAQLAWSSASFAKGEIEEAEYHATVALTNALHQGDPLFVGYARLNLAAVATAKQQWLEAVETYRDGISLLLDRPQAGALSQGMMGLANLAIQIEAYAPAIRLLHVAHELKNSGAPAPPHLIAFDLEQLAETLEALPRKQKANFDPTEPILGVSDVEPILELSIAEISEALAPASSIAVRRGPAELTKRELEVLCLLVEDMTDLEVADALFIGKRTAETHVSSIIGKLGVNSRVGAVAYALREGLCV